MLAAGQFAEGRPEHYYIPINKEVDMPVEAATNNPLLETFGISLQKVERERMDTTDSGATTENVHHPHQDHIEQPQVSSTA